jgi:hypothetical protein
MGPKHKTGRVFSHDPFANKIEVRPEHGPRRVMRQRQPVKYTPKADVEEKTPACSNNERRPAASPKRLLVVQIER